MFFERLGGRHWQQLGGGERFDPVQVGTDQPESIPFSYRNRLVFGGLRAEVRRDRDDPRRHVRRSEPCRSGPSAAVVSSVSHGQYVLLHLIPKVEGEGVDDCFVVV
jgi:hypothetical protein